MSYLKDALRGTVSVFAFSAIGILFAYMFRILLARNLGVAEYGLFYSLYALFVSLSVFTDLGLAHSALRQAITFKVDGKKELMKGSLLSVLAIQLAISFILLIAVASFSEEIGDLYLKSGNIAPLLIMAVWFFLLPIPSFLANFFLTFQKPGIAGSLEAVRQVVACVATFVLLELGFGVLSPFIAYASISVVMLLAYLPVMKRSSPEFFTTRFSMNKQVLKNIFTYGFFIAITFLVSTMLLYADSVMLTFFKGIETVGIYQAAVPLSNLMGVIGVALSTVAYPLVIELYSRKKKAALKDGLRLLYLYSVAAAVLLGLVLFAYPEMIISLLFGAQYSVAAEPLRILVFYGVMSILISLNCNVLFGIGKTKSVAAVTGTAAVMNVILNLFLIPPYGMMGAAIATTSSAFITVVLSGIMIKKSLKMGMPWKSWFLSFLSAAITLGYIAWMKFVLELWIWLEAAIVMSAGCVLYIGLLLLFKVIDFKETREFIMTILPSRENNGPAQRT